MRALLVAWFVCLVLIRTVQAGMPFEGTMEEFRPTVETIAASVAKVLKARRESAITVGTITGPPTLGSAVGPGIRQLFVEELARVGIRTAKLGTEIGLSGEYRLAKATPKQATTQVQLEMKLVDSSGQVLTDLASSVDMERSIDGPRPKDDGKLVINTHTTPEATALAMGLTVDMDQLNARLSASEFFTRDVVKEMLDKPTAYVQNNNVLRASNTSLYGLQVVVAGKARPLRLEDGRVFVELNKGDAFTLKLLSDAPFHVAGTFTLDGVSSFAFSDVKDEGRPKYTRWILPPRQALELKGWHKNNETVRQFLVSDFSESAAALVGAEGQLGTLSVVVRATWPFNTPPPPGEPAMPGAAASAAPDIGVGFGRLDAQRAAEDTTQRDFGRVRSIMNVHYTKPT